MASGLDKSKLTGGQKEWAIKINQGLYEVPHREYNPQKDNVGRYLRAMKRCRQEARLKGGKRAAAIKATKKIGKDILDSLLPSMK